jgi:MFS family permease
LGDAVAPPAGLSRNRDFLLLWGGQSVSRLGTEVTQLAIPLVAVATLHGSALQVAAIVAIEYLPSLLFGLPAGVWVDRLESRLLLVLSDFGRFLALGAVPLMAALDVLTFAALYAAVFIVGVLTLLYDLAYQSMLPRVVAAADLLEANGRLEATRSVAAGVGPLVGGGLVQVLTAPLAVLADAVSYAVSGICAAFMRPAHDARPPEERAFRAELAEGIRAVWRDSLQRRLAATALTSNFFAAAIHAMYILYAFRELGLSPLLIGLTLAAGALGAVAAAFALKWVSRAANPATAVRTGLAVSALGYLLVPLADAEPRALAVTVLCAGSLLGQAGLVVVAARAMAWRQQITPLHLLGRVISVTRTLAFGILPLGALLAGMLADRAGVRTALVVAALGMLSACLWLVGAPGSPPQPAGREQDARDR